MSFKYRFIISFVTIEIFFIFLIVLFNFKAITDSSKELIKEKIDSNIAFLKNLVVIPLSVYDLATLDNITDNTAQIKYINSIVILNKEDKIVSANYKFRHKSIREILKINKDNEFYIDDNYYELRYVDFNEEGVYKGSMYVIFDHSKNRAFLNEIKNNNILLISLEILISTILSFLIGNSLNNKLRNLSQVARDIGKNKKIQIPYLELNDEIGILSKSLNQMKLDLENRNKDLKDLTKNLIEQKFELIKTQKHKDSFFANMSHELRTPLNSINILSSLMMNNKKGNLDETQTKNLTIINDCGKKLTDLINDVMDISKIEAGELKINSVFFDFDKAMGKIYQIFQVQVEKKGLEFIFKKNTSIDFITNDEKLIGQILINLLSNAVKFTNKGKIELIINDKGEFIEFIIKDQGIGISNDKLVHIFERFKQVDESINRKYGGTGLGLAISKELVNLLSGNIRVESKPGIGSKFTVLIKKNIETQNTIINQEEISYKEIIPKKVEESRKKDLKNIIILNKDPLYYFDIVLKLKKNSYNVKQIRSFENLLEILKNETIIYDKIIVDLDSVNQNDLLVFLESNKIILTLISNNPKEIQDDINKKVKIILDKSKKNIVLESLCL